MWPFTPLYRLGLAVRARKFRSGNPSIQRLQWPVISIGNLSTGGSGKTPLTISLAKTLTARGLHVDVLSRGYGRRSTLPVVVDPIGTAEDFGDEPLEIARAAGVPVYVAAERYQAGLLAEAAAPSGVHILDDGFQHRQLARDVDILLLSAADLEDRLLPAGNLREALGAAARADVIAIPFEENSAPVKSLGSDAKIWRLHRRMNIPRIDGPVAAFCGIARPQQFFVGLEAAGVRAAARLAFGDHHRYTVDDVRRIEREALSVGAEAILTTEKDQVRLGALAAALNPSLPLRTVPLRIEIENEDAAVNWLIERIKRVQARS
jgi:tetraacyldisaccharide 4'-kinase